MGRTKTLNRRNFLELKNALVHTIMISDYLLKYVFPKNDRSMDIDKLSMANRDGVITISITCPFHVETEPSFRVYPTRNDYFCYGACRKGGSIIELHQQVRLEVDGVNLSKIQAMEELASLYHINYKPLYDILDEITIYTPQITQQEVEQFVGTEFNTSPQRSVLTIISQLERDFSVYHNEKSINQIKELDYLMSLKLNSDELLYELEVLTGLREREVVVAEVEPKDIVLNTPTSSALTSNHLTPNNFTDSQLTNSIFNSETNNLGDKVNEGDLLDISFEDLVLERGWDI